MQNEMNLANDSFIATISNQGVILKDQIFYIQVQPLIRKKLEFKVKKIYSVLIQWNHGIKVVIF